MAKQFQKELDELKLLLCKADDFSLIFNYFMDHLGEKRAFLNAGKKKKNPLVKKMIQVAGERAFKEKVSISHFFLIKFGKPAFYHGSFLLGNRMGSVIYFKDIEMGMVSISEGPGSDMVHYVRISATIMDGDTNPANIMRSTAGRLH